MGVVIENVETEAKIRELAERTGETLTTAVDRAVDERLARLGPAAAPDKPAPAPQRKGRIDREKLAEILAYFDSLPVDNEVLTDEEIIGYDENGLPK